MNISVAVVNYNTREHLEACLASVVAERPGHIIVVDNDSDDGSPEMVKSDYPQVELILAPNEGFGAGANAALRRATSPYVLLLNSDTRLRPGALAALAAYLEGHLQVGMVGPRLVNPDGSLQPSVYPAPGPIAELLRWTSLASLARRFSRLRDRYFLCWPHHRAASVGWVVGAALAIRKDAFEAVGGFDTSFFMYSEEVDLAYRVQKAGWEVHFTPDATVTHIGGASTDAYRAEMMARLFDSMRHLYAKHFPPRWQRQLKVIITYLMLRNVVRDRWRLMCGRGPAAREQLTQDLAAWHQVLRLIWSA